MRTFTLAGPADHIDFNTGTADAGGCYWMASDLFGWDGADISLDLTPRLRSPGQLATAGQVLGRTLSVRDAMLLAPTEEARRVAVDRFAALILSIASDDVAGLLTVHDPVSVGVTLDRQCAVASNQRPTAIDRSPGPAAIAGTPLGIVWPSVLNWSILAPDPLRYASAGSLASMSSGVTTLLTNDGSAPAYPYLTLTGLSSPITLAHSESGRSVVLSGSMPGSLLVHFDNRDVLDAGTGADRYDLVTSLPAAWWTLSPGANHLTVYGASADASWRSAWW